MRKNYLLFFLLISISFTGYSKIYKLESPNKKLTADIVTSNNNPTSYSLSFCNDTIVYSSPISMSLSDGNKFGVGMAKKANHGSHSDVVKPIIYHKSEIQDNYNYLTLDFVTHSIEFRAYNNGFAWRFISNKRLPYKVMEETATFSFSPDSKAWIPYLNLWKDGDGQFESGFESFYSKSPISEWKKDKYAFTPLMVAVPNSSVKMCIAESDLYDYPGMSLVSNNGDGVVKSIFAKVPKAEKQGGPHQQYMYVDGRYEYIAECNGDKRTFPWRIVCVSQNDCEMADNDMVYLLARPADENMDFSWVKPGKSAWEWWSYWNLKNVDFKTGINNEEYKYFIDFASNHGIEYVMMDAGWFDEDNHDKLVPIEGLDIEGICKYANSKGVGMILWTGYACMSKHMEETLAYYSSIGAKGFKIDYENRDDQIIESYLPALAKMAAKYHMVIDIHGVHKPTGLERAYPNLLNYEGVKGLENAKYIDNGADMVEYDVEIPFIRFVAGFADYTQGAMRNVIKGNYYKCHSEPMSAGTRCHQLAEYVVFKSPLVMMCDSPSNYLSEPEYTGFLTEIPVTWDETRIIDGKVGEYIITARRKGSVWYIAGLTNWDSRDISIDLSFISSGSGSKNVLLYTDGLNADKVATDYSVTSADATEPLKIHMAPGGGFVVRVE